MTCIIYWGSKARGSSTGPPAHQETELRASHCQSGVWDPQGCSPDISIRPCHPPPGCSPLHSILHWLVLHTLLHPPEPLWVLVLILETLSSLLLLAHSCSGKMPSPFWRCSLISKWPVLLLLSWHALWLFVFINIHSANTCWVTHLLEHYVRCLWIFSCPFTLSSRHLTRPQIHRWLVFVDVCLCEFLYRDVFYFFLNSRELTKNVHRKFSLAIWWVHIRPGTYPTFEWLFFPLYNLLAS